MCYAAQKHVMRCKEETITILPSWITLSCGLAGTAVHKKGADYVTNVTRCPFFYKYLIYIHLHHDIGIINFSFKVELLIETMGIFCHQKPTENTAQLRVRKYVF